MKSIVVEPARTCAAWEGRISGCMPGSSVVAPPLGRSRSALEAYVREAAGLPLRDYIPLLKRTVVERTGSVSRQERSVRAEVDAWTRPWTCRIGVSLFEFAELQLNEVVARTVPIARRIDVDQYDET